MQRSRTLLALLCVGFTLALISPRPAAAGTFSQAWSLSGWDYRQNLGNCTGGPEPILLFTSKTDGHYALFDGHTGAVVQDFASFQSATFKDTTTVCQSADWNGDGINEIVFNQEGVPTPIFWVLKWNGTTFATMFHPIGDKITGWSLVHARSASSYDLLTSTPNNIKIRNGATGSVLWQASTALPGWVGTTPFSETQDLDGDGLDEMAVGDYGTSTAVIKYASGSFTTLWSNTGWKLDLVTNLDSDSPPEFRMTNTADNHYGIFKSLTGVETGDFPTVTQSAGYNMLPLSRDLVLGAPVIAVWKPTPSPALMLMAWNGSSFNSPYQNIDPIKSVLFPSLRDTTMQEIVEVEANDVLIRDGLGNQLFKASTGIPGWTAALGTVVVPVNFVGGGVNDLLIYDGGVGGVLRRLHYSGGSFTQAWALSGYSFSMDVGNTDSDPEHELLCINYSGDKSFNLVDSQTGVVKQHWPQFTNGTSLIVGAGDYWGDGKNEIILTRLDGTLLGNSTTSVTTGFRWNGASVAPLFTVADSIRSAEVYQLRDNLHHELMTLTTSNDIRLRDVFDGTPLFDASSQLAGWTGVDPNSSQGFGTLDFAGDGTQDLYLTEPGDVRFIEHYGTTAVPGSGGPLAFRVEQNSPNPFRSATTLRFSMPVAGGAEVRIYDTAGRLVRQLDRVAPAGPNVIEWDGRDAAGQSAPSGVLFYEIRAGGMRQSRKAVHLQ